MLTCWATNAAGMGCTPVTPVVFCEVSAVMTESPYAESEVNVLRSACESSQQRRGKRRRRSARARTNEQVSSPSLPSGDGSLGSQHPRKGPIRLSSTQKKDWKLKKASALE